MGNSQSSDPPKSPSVSSTPHRDTSRRERDREGTQHRNAGGRDVSSSSGRKAPWSSHAKAPPITASLLPSSTASTSTSNAYAHATVTAGPASSHSRARSITASAPPGTRRDESASSHQSSPMGNAESRHRPPSRSQTLPPPPQEKAEPSPLSQPVDVPQRSRHDIVSDGDIPMNSPLFNLPPSDLSRPPRLPLAIDRDPEPAYPISTPQDANTPLETVDEVELVQRPGSMLSSTTLDDDEVADIETFTLESDPYTQKVSTTLQWRGEGKSVYVTGTFAHWEKKFRMQKTQEADGNSLFTLTAPLPTGTHHIMFLVDGEMRLSNHYPTTVDYTNSLVNYIEIAAPRPPVEARAPAQPVPIPNHPAGTAHGQAGRPLDIRTGAPVPETDDELASTLHEAVGQAPGLANAPHEVSMNPEQLQQTQQPKPQKKKEPRPKYVSDIPEFLLHIDLYNTPEDERFRRATKATQHLPQPPSLPMFMSKSILNAATPHKDDASVLTMPNHTVLNHLATSSIRSGVLATSGTTRYKRKFLTTIMYKPTSSDGG